MMMMMVVVVMMMVMRRRRRYNDYGLSFYPACVMVSIKIAHGDFNFCFTHDVSDDGK